MVYTHVFFLMTAIFVSIFNYLLDDCSYHAVLNKRQPYNHISHWISKVDRRGRERMVFGFTTTSAISAYHHQHCEFESRSHGEMYLIQHYKIK